MVKIGVIISSIRDGRVSTQVADWVKTMKTIC